MHVRIGFLFLFLFLSGTILAQTFAWGITAGPSVGFQRWERIEQDPLYKYHFQMFIESAPEDDKFALYSRLGYHIRGASLRNRFFFDQSGNVRRLSTRGFEFRNLVLSVGAKKKMDFRSNWKAYYALGLRGEMNINTNLSDYDEVNQLYPIYPIEGFTQRFLYGFSLGGGLEIPIGDLVRIVTELSVHPDLGKQYRQPPINNVPDPWNIGNVISLPQREISNNSIELTIGFRFMRKVVYVD